MIDVAVSYTPPGSDVSMTLATIRDIGLLIAALKLAIIEADRQLRAASESPIASRGIRKQRDLLAACLAEITGPECAAGVI